MTNKSDCYTLQNSNSAYHNDVDIYSSSMLKNAIESPATFIQCLLERYKGSKATNFGSIMHALVLEPHTVNELVAIYPVDLNRTKECAIFKLANPNRFCISLRDFIQAQNLAEKILNQVFRGKTFRQYIAEGTVERSIYYTDPITGLKCRTRPDLLHPEFTFDLKTTRYWSQDSFDRQAIDLHYDLSAYMYTLSRFLLEKSASASPEAVTVKPFVIVSVCTEAPHSVFFRPTSYSFLQNGQKKYESSVAIIKACSQVQTWPAMGGEKEIDLAPWQMFSSNINSSLPSSL